LGKLGDAFSDESPEVKIAALNAVKILAREVPDSALQHHDLLVLPLMLLNTAKGPVENAFVL